MKCRGKKDQINVQAVLSRDQEAEPVGSLLEDVIQIMPNICVQKDVCGGCERGNRYGLPLHFLLHYADGGFRTVCFSCGAAVADKTGLRLPPTESDIFAREEKADSRLIRIAMQKIEAKNE